MALEEEEREERKEKQQQRRKARAGGETKERVRARGELCPRERKAVAPRTRFLYRLYRVGRGGRAREEELLEGARVRGSRAGFIKRRSGLAGGEAGV